MNCEIDWNSASCISFSLLHLNSQTTEIEDLTGLVWEQLLGFSMV